MKFICALTLILTSQFVFTQSYSKYGVENEDENLPVGLEFGSTAPAFTLLDSKGNSHSLVESLKNGPVVLIFYRGQWCPVCSRYLSAVQDSLDQILETGAKLYAVTPEMAENAQKIEEEAGTTFPVLIDSDEKVMKEYDVLFDVTSAYQTKIKVGFFTSIEKNNDKEEARLPVPATYIIDQKGNVVFKQFDYNYKIRASVKDMLKSLESIK